MVTNATHHRDEIHRDRPNLGWHLGWQANLHRVYTGLEWQNAVKITATHHRDKRGTNAVFERVHRDKFIGRLENVFILFLMCVNYLIIQKLEGR